MGRIAEAASISRFCKKCQASTERKANGDCKPCAKVLKKAWYEANRAKANATSAAYYEKNKAQIKLVAAVYREANKERVKETTAAWVKKNYARRIATKAAWRAANIERIREVVATYAKANQDAMRIYSENRRARKRENGGALSRDLAAKLFQLQKGLCPCCKQPLGDNAHLDHIIPLALGGSNTDDNMQLLRATCNCSKGAKHPVDFMQSRGFLL